MRRAEYIKASEVELFGTILETRPKSWRFAAEDEIEVWLPKSLCQWDGLTMTMPTWLARKRRLIAPLPPDNDPAWSIILEPPRTFIADTILKVVK